MKKEYILEIIDRGTGKIVQTETRKSQKAFARMWGRAMVNINPLKYKLKAITMCIIVLLAINCSKHTDMPGLTGPRGATGETGEDGQDGQDGKDGKDGQDGSGIRKGFHVIGFGDPNDTSAPNTGTVILNNEVLWDTVTTKPTSFIVYIPGTKHPDDLVQVSGTGSKTRISYHFEVKHE